METEALRQLVTDWANDAAWDLLKRLRAQEPTIADASEEDLAGDFVVALYGTAAKAIGMQAP